MSVDTDTGLVALDPLLDERWPRFVEEHPNSSVFHTRGWLEALQRTYGYRPVAFTRASAGTPLSDCLLFCEVRSWLTGRRLVSLPFSDHCQPLVSEPEELERILGSLQELVDAKGWRYVELRPRDSPPEGEPSAEFPLAAEHSLHLLDLTPSAEELFRGMHKSCMQRKVRRAEREELVYVSGRSDELLRDFYQLVLATRRRHELPPQPFAWFRNLVRCLGEQMTIHQVSTPQGRPVASIVTLTHKSEVVYKYGASDSSLNPLGGMPFLLWEAIRQAKEASATLFDLGRSDLDNPGLIKFKDRLGAQQSALRYFRRSASKGKSTRETKSTSPSRKLVSLLPDPLLRLSGRLLYRHFG